MCGIAAWLEASPRPAVQLVRMMKLVDHRGPDDEGFLGLHGFGETPLHWKENSPSSGPDLRIALGHRRLSVIDLSDAGRQPMSDPSGRLHLVYNGEIYNHPELREELKERGHLFRTRTDTEVLLAAWLEWGEDCLQRFNGMFAFVLMDARDRRLYAVRDRFGIKPLYYQVTSTGGIVFASEIKQFTALDDWAPRLNGQRCYDYLAWALTDHTEETCFEGVRQVPPGGIIWASSDDAGSKPTVETRRWYQLPAQAIEVSLEESAGETRRLLTDSVRLRLRSDVTVGSCLSGGIDSSSIVCLIDRLSEEASAPPKTFTARFPGDVIDEGQWSSLVSENTRTTPVQVLPRPDEVVSSLPGLVWMQDEPFGSTSIFAQSEVFRSARANGVTVMLDGQGADEQFAGYDTFVKNYLRYLRGNDRRSELRRELSATRAWRGSSLRSLADWLKPFSADNRDKPEWLDLQKLGATPNDLFDSLGSRDCKTEDLARTMIENRNLQMLLRWEDRNSMAHSVEARVPFLDHRLVEYVLSTPGEHRLKGGITKKLLREAMKGIVPDPILDRRDKLGFATPEETWIRTQSPNAFEHLVDQAIESSNGILLPNETRAEARALLTGERKFTFQLWRFVCFGAWLDRFSISP